MNQPPKLNSQPTREKSKIYSITETEKAEINMPATVYPIICILNQRRSHLFFSLNAKAIVSKAFSASDGNKEAIKSPHVIETN